MPEFGMSSVVNLSSWNVTASLLVLVVCLVVHRLLSSRSSSQNHRLHVPPYVKYWLPFIGHLHLLSSNPGEQFRGFRKQLGDIFRLRLGNRDCVVICGFDAIKDALLKNGDVFLNRPDMPLGDNFTRGEGIVMANGEKWKEQRRFMLKTMKDIGMGKTKLESKIHKELDKLFDVVDTKNGQPLDPELPIQTITCNIMFAMVFSSTLEHGDPELVEVIRGIEESLDLGIILGVLAFVPVLQWLPGDPFKMKKLTKNADHLFKFVQSKTDERLQHFDGETVTDYVTAHYHHVRTLEKSGQPTSFNLEGITGTCVELFVASVESTTVLLRWSLPFLATHPEIQARMYDDIEKYVGTERMPSLGDRKNLAYVEAFYTECLRFTNLTAVDIPHVVSRDVDFHGFHFPEGLMVLYDFGSVLADPDIWKDPETFMPDRFLDESGNLRKMQEFIAFSLGKRSCVGESLARMELLIIIAAIVQKYELVCPEGQDLSMAQIDGIYRTVHAPKPYEIVFKRR